jgi:hypothetical protein
MKKLTLDSFSYLITCELFFETYLNKGILIDFPVINNEYE